MLYLILYFIYSYWAPACWWLQHTLVAFFRNSNVSRKKKTTNGFHAFQVKVSSDFNEFEVCCFLCVCVCVKFKSTHVGGQGDCFRLKFCSHVMRQGGLFNEDKGRKLWWLQFLYMFLKRLCYFSFLFSRCVRGLTTCFAIEENVCV